ncbi:MAG: hypothetical protein KGJ74_01490 [Betaproteobacteria bacterium]|nr:hypothetical protein [Betaproteobacteria bacterium]
MSTTPATLYLAQAFHHGDAERHSYVVCIGHKERVEHLALAEHERRAGEYGIAIYEVTVDSDFQKEPRLVRYLSSVMAERWIADAPQSPDGSKTVASSNRVP